MPLAMALLGQWTEALAWKAPKVSPERPIFRDLPIYKSIEIIQRYNQVTYPSLCFSICSRISHFYFVGE
jgi:hypothetical protein